MLLSELADYAEEKYQIKEEHKWAEMPGFSVLADPQTGKWAALLMRRWDYERGEEILRCDIKCGRQCISEFQVPYVTNAFRMKGNKWVGVIFDDRTDPEIVFELFDRAVRALAQRGFNIVLDSADDDRGAGKKYSDTLLPLESMRGNYDKRRLAQREAQDRRKKEEEKHRREAQIDSALRSRTGAFVNPSFSGRGNTSGGALTPGALADQIPPRILEMMKLYEYGSSTVEHKCRNFYRQGKFMEDYEDDAPWGGEYRRYFTTYHDLNLNQLRGYFAWRTLVRRGVFRRITTSLAYMYLYELLNGIGASSPEESLSRMKEFEAGYLDSGIGDPSMRENLRRWRMEYAVLHGSSTGEVLPFIDPELIERDRKLQVLRSPQEYTDEEVYGALSALSGGKTEKSSVILREPERGRHLFAEVWRYMSLHYMDDGWDIFTACFGKMKKFPWHPLANAVYLDREERGETVYEINACRKFVYKSGQWSEMRYDELFFDKYRIGAIMHEADRQLRRYLKTGHYLREKAGEEWIAPYVEAVIEADREAAAEAAKPRITIDLSGLDKIRRDAQITRDSLLTEEEMREQETVETKPETPVIEAPAIIPDREETAVQPEASEPFNLSVENDKKSVHEEPGTVTIEIPSLDEVHAQILLMLMRGESPAGLIRKEFLMPSVVTDTINEALFDEIGDNVLECDGDEIALVEDYREEVTLILNGEG